MCSVHRSCVVFTLKGLFQLFVESVLLNDVEPNFGASEVSVMETTSMRPCPRTRRVSGCIFVQDINQQDMSDSRYFVIGTARGSTVLLF